ncbi:MAG: glycoside hydrolase family 127 protein [Planctomycetaceae bacterium]|jgi:DUF1680 family protein|nr:glycoside hydrolase family 127 protein [Planctomycetaceae bacterium]
MTSKFNFINLFSATIAGKILSGKMILLSCFLFFSGTVLFAQTKIIVEDVFEPLPAGEVKLSGVLDNDIHKMHDNWNKQTLPYDKLADFFRKGRPQFAVGEMWGKAVRSSSLLYRYTQDVELKKILDATVADMITTQQPNGSISCDKMDKQPGDKGGDIWERRYVMLGMLAYYENVNSNPKVLECVKQQADCLLQQIGNGKTEIIDLGWSADNCGYEKCHIESTAILECFTKLYAKTQEKKYLDFAEYILASGGTKHYNIFEQAYDHTPPYKMAGHYPKCYEMLCVFEGVVDYYRLTGKEYWRDCALRHYEGICEHEITILGSGGGNMPHHPRIAAEAWDNTAVEQTNPATTKIHETCTGVAWLKYLFQTLQLTGNPEMVDYAEKYIYNILRSSVKPDGKGCAYMCLLNGSKVGTQGGWGYNVGGVYVSCCNLNVPAALALLPQFAVMRDKKHHPVVNLYIPSIVKTKTPKGQPLELQIITDYPNSGNVKIKVNVENPEEFTVKLKIPSWSENTQLASGDLKLPLPQAGKYAEIKKTWKSDNEINLTFDMRCKLIDAPKGGSAPNSDKYKALRYGSLVLSRNSEIDSDYNKPVTIIADQNGFVDAKPTTNADGSLVFDIPTSTGFIKMFPYAHINGWNGAKIQTWLPTP